MVYGNGGTQYGFIRLSGAEKIFQAFNYIYLTFLAFVTLYPFYYVIISSFSDPFSVRNFFWINELYTTNYELVLTKTGIGRAYLITVLRVAVGVPLMLLVTGATAFMLTRKDLLFRTPIIIYFLITMFLSGGIIPMYMVLRTLGLLDSFWVLVLPTMFSVWTMIIMKTCFQGLPEGLVDAGLIDGASFITIFLRIILPLSKAMLAAMGLFYAVLLWNDWFAGAFYIRNFKLLPLQTFLRIYVLEGSALDRLLAHKLKGPRALDMDVITPESLKNAFIVVSVVPIMAVYPFLQRYFIKGVLIGSIK